MIFLGLGTNEGDRIANLQKALGLLWEQEVRLLRCSSIYQTEPWGITEQDIFLNIVCEVSWAGSEEKLLETVLSVEQTMGRIRIQKWGPRLIDIDIVDFQRKIVETPHLSLPHPYYQERDFVLVPLAELEPEWMDEKGTPIQRLIDQLGHTGIRIFAAPILSTEISTST